MKTTIFKKTKKIAALSLTSAALIFAYQNCAPEHQFDETELSSLQGGNPADYYAEEAMDQARISTQEKLASCRFIGRDALASQLEEQLGLQRRDTNMANSSGDNLRSDACKSYVHRTGDGTRNCRYLREYAAELDTTLCNESTFSLVSKIMVNACTEGLRDNAVAERLFPNGSADASHVYLAFTGQQIQNSEREVLQGLVASIESEQAKQTAICAAVSSSMAAISVN